MITLFQLLLWSLFAFLKMEIWFHFSENGPTDILTFPLFGLKNIAILI